MGIVEKIESHLQFARQYEEIGKHDPFWHSATGLVEQAITDLDPGGVKILREIPPAEIYADPLTEKVFYNLFENALRHSSPLTMIRVSATEEDSGYLVLVFEDDGMGIAYGETERIFSRFYGKNTGLGLTFSREILSVTDIRIQESGVPGAGARFEIHVPPPSWRYS
ncbi:MAG: sensor histidine kinase [Methanoregula sp.]|jgi:signal transduction histidine kinase|nr:sensor histidine kinase [Methanoregula sp.]